VVVVRTAYGPGGPLGWMYGHAIAERGHSGTVGDVTVPVSSITGRRDIFLTGRLRDFQAVAAVGRTPG
jgi:hypothetical protein